MRHDYVGMSITMANSTSLAKVDSGTLANIAIVLFVSVLAIIHLKAVIQPLVVATLIFFLIRPPAQWLEGENRWPSINRLWGSSGGGNGVPTLSLIHI